MTGFYMKCNTRMNWVKAFHWTQKAGTTLGAQLYLGTQPCYKALSDIRIKIPTKMQRLTSSLGGWHPELVQRRPWGGQVAHKKHSWRIRKNLRKLLDETCEKYHLLNKHKVNHRLTLLWRRPLSYRNQWTGFYMITVSVMKELSCFNRLSCYTYLNKTIAIANVNSGKHLTDVNTLHNNQLPI